MNLVDAEFDLLLHVQVPVPDVRLLLGEHVHGVGLVEREACARQRVLQRADVQQGARLAEAACAGLLPGLEQLAELLHLVGEVLVELVPDVLAVHGLWRVALVAGGDDVAAGVDDVEAVLALDADLHRTLLQRPRATPLPLFAARIGRGGGEFLIALAAQDLPHRTTAEPRGIPDNLPEVAAPTEEPTDVIGDEEGGDAL